MFRSTIASLIAAAMAIAITIPKQPEPDAVQLTAKPEQSIDVVNWKPPVAERETDETAVPVPTPDPAPNADDTCEDCPDGEQCDECVCSKNCDCRGLASFEIPDYSNEFKAVQDRFEAIETGVDKGLESQKKGLESYVQREVAESRDELKSYVDQQWPWNSVESRLAEVERQVKTLTSKVDRNTRDIDDLERAILSIRGENGTTAERTVAANSSGLRTVLDPGESLVAINGVRLATPIRNNTSVRRVYSVPSGDYSSASSATSATSGFQSSGSCSTGTCSPSVPRTSYRLRTILPIFGQRYGSCATGNCN